MYLFILKTIAHDFIPKQTGTNARYQKELIFHVNNKNNLFYLFVFTFLSQISIGYGIIAF